MNTDSKGSKVAEKEVSKKVQSKNVREKRISLLRTAEKPNKKFCLDCGFRIRSKDHDAGTHHIHNRVQVD